MRCRGILSWIAGLGFAIGVAVVMLGLVIVTEKWWLPAIERFFEFLHSGGAPVAIVVGGVVIIGFVLLGRWLDRHPGDAEQRPLDEDN